MFDPTTQNRTPRKSSPLSMMVSAQDRDTSEMVRNALEKKHVLLAFQPIMQAKDPGKVAFFEGLIRVLDQKGRIIPARDFINVVEDDKMGRILDTLALEKGLQALATEPSLRLSINMSAKTIGCAHWNQTLLRGLRNDPTAGERLIIEISEQTAIMVPDIVYTFMRDVQLKGVSFALDDFGAGHSSFNFLKDFSFDILKIDGSFVHDIHADADKQVITQAIIAMARALEMFTVAGYVEDHNDAEVLIDLGADCLQGYYFGAPTITPYWVKADPRRMAG